MDVRLAPGAGRGPHGLQVDDFAMERMANITGYQLSVKKSGGLS
jgi:hypothetical protein